MKTPAQQVAPPTAGSDEAGPASARSRRPLGRRFPRARIMITLVGLVLVLNLVHVHAYTLISPFDEYAHIDSVARGAHGQVLVQPDDELGQDTLREVACRGSEFTGFPRCRPGQYDPERFVYRGWNQASSHSPYYYVITGTGVRVLRAPPTGGGIVTWARILGSAWLLVGFYLVVRAAEYLGVRRGPLALVLIMTAAAPAVLHSSTTVNPDAAGIVGGGAVLLAALAWEKGARSLWALALGAFVCAALDTTNVVGVIVVLGYLGLRAIASYRGDATGDARAGTSYLRALPVVAGSAFAAIFGWKLMYNLLAHNVDLSNHPSRKLFDVDTLDIGTVLGRDTVFGIFPPLDGYVPSVLDNAAYLAFVSAAVLVVTGALLAVSFRLKLSDPLSTLGLATLVALLVSAPVLVLYNYFADGLYFPILTRQALSAVPAVALVTASMASFKVGRAVLAIVALGLYVSAVATLI